MIQKESKVRIVDNTGGREGKILQVLKGSTPRFATVGDKVVLSVRSAAPKGQVTKGEISRGVVVRTVKEVRRKDGSYIRFGDNAVALINKEGKSKGKRVFGPVAKELREKGHKDIASLAEEVI